VVVSFVDVVAETLVDVPSPTVLAVVVVAEGCDELVDVVVVD
jgi:hypothetical protein